MYRIDVLVNLKWKYLYENDDLLKIDLAIYKALKEGHQIRVLQDNILITFLNSIEEFDYWKMIMNIKKR